MQHPWSIARRLAAAQLLGLLVLTVFAGWASFVQTRDTVHRLEGERVMSAAQLLAQEIHVLFLYAALVRRHEALKIRRSARDLSLLCAGERQLEERL